MRKTIFLFILVLACFANANEATLLGGSNREFKHNGDCGDAFGGCLGPPNLSTTATGI